MDDEVRLFARRRSIRVDLDGAFRRDAIGSFRLACKRATATLHVCDIGQDRLLKEDVGLGSLPFVEN